MVSPPRSSGSGLSQRSTFTVMSITISIKSAKLSVEINSSELIVQTPAREVWIGRGSFEGYPGVTEGITEANGSRVNAHYYRGGFFSITTRKHAPAPLPVSLIGLV